MNIFSNTVTAPENTTTITTITLIIIIIIIMRVNPSRNKCVLDSTVWPTLRLLWRRWCPARKVAVNILKSMWSSQACWMDEMLTIQNSNSLMRYEIFQKNSDWD